MHILCAISGVEFKVEHFPGSLSARECYHPIFCITQKKLLQFTHKWANRELTPTDKYLLFLALLHSTDLVEWRVPAQRNNNTDSVIEQNMESLVQIVGKINLINHPAFVLPRVAITPETKSLQNVHWWIQNWEESYIAFLSGYKDQERKRKILDREERLLRLIRDENKPISHYARILADWAESAGAFPQYLTSVDGRKMPINEYWKNIIVACCREEKIFLIPKDHIELLLSYCEENIDAGSTYAYTLFDLLRAGLRKQNNYLGLGDIDLQSTTYRILPSETSIEDANKLAMIDSAPVEKPIEANYPSKLAYLRAKIKWDMKQEYQEQQIVVAKLTKEVIEPTAEEIENALDDTEESDDATLGGEL
jgi:hypothetical protein